MSSVARSWSSEKGKSSRKGKGAVLSNTPPMNSNQGMDGLVMKGGEDTASIGLGVTWDESFDELMRALRQCKETAQEEGKEVPFRYRGLEGLVLQGGSASGRGKGSYYAYRVRIEGVLLKLVRRQVPSKGNDNVRVEMGSLVLMREGGLEVVWERVKEVIEALGGQVAWNKVSRVDACLDVAGLDTKDAVQRIQEGKCVSRSKKETFHREGREWTGFDAGRGGAVMMRVYDKLREVGGDEEKWVVLVASRWGGEPEVATRIEFQLRRDWLKEHEVDTVEDYLRERGAIVEYLCEEWFRVTEGEVDAANTTRVKVWSVWEKITAAFKAWAGASSGLRRRKKLLDRDYVTQKRMVIGCLSTMLCPDVGGEILSLTDFIEACCSRVKEAAEQFYSGEKFAETLYRYAVAGGTSYHWLEE